MEFSAVNLLYLGVGGAALLAGHLWRGRKSKSEAAQPDEILVTRAIDRANFLQALRREMANVLIWRNPKNYLQIYRELRSLVASFYSFRLEEIQRILNEICDVYPNYVDFDLISTREYVLYADGFSSFPDEIIENCYRNIIQFVALSVLAKPEWKEAASRGFVHGFDDAELLHLSRYVQKIEDTKMKLRIEQAMDAYFARSREFISFDSDFCSVRPIQSVIESRYGIHLKRTGEFAICRLFVTDDDKTIYHYYRSDVKFEQEAPLDTLNAVVDDIKYQY